MDFVDIVSAIDRSNAGVVVYFSIFVDGLQL